MIRNKTHEARIKRLEELIELCIQDIESLQFKVGMLQSFVDAQNKNRQLHTEALIASFKSPWWKFWRTA